VIDAVLDASFGGLEGDIEQAEGFLPSVLCGSFAP